MLADLTAWVKAHPGRFTHPDPRDFLGASFLKQALIDLAPDAQALSAPADDASLAMSACRRSLGSWWPPRDSSSSSSPAAGEVAERWVGI